MKNGQLDLQAPLNGFADRRTLLKAGLAASSMSLLGASVVGQGDAWMARAAPAPFYKFVYDPAHGEAVGFASAARRAGLTVEPVGADITSFWYDDLYHHWRGRRAAIAGLTGVAAAYCIEIMARDAGLRTVFRGVHHPGASGGLVHTLAGVRPALDVQASLAAGPGWGAALATALSRYPLSGGEGRKLPIDYAPALHPTPTTPLVSWLIEPITRV